MVNGFTIVNYILGVFFLIWLTLMFYFSVKKCFLKEGQSKVQLFFRTFFSSPLVVYIQAAVVFFLGAYFSPQMHDYIEESRISDMNVLERIIYSVSTGSVFIILSILYAYLTARWLKAEMKSAVLFMYLMFDTVMILTNRSSGSGEMFGVPYLRDIIDLIGTIILFIAVWLFYKLDVTALSEMKGTSVKVDWKIFNIPPALFAFIYSVLMTWMSLDPDQNQEKLMLVLYFFTTIIVFLFIWAFYVIIKNINATDVAVKAKEEVKKLSVEVMEALAHTIDAKDEYTRGHSVRVANYSRMIAERLGMSQEECDNAYYMGLLHDIGKIGVPNEIINSPYKLTDDEYAVVKTHPGLGFDILSEIKSRPDLVIGARWHHERYDGQGYPDGKKGEEIPLLARIISVADSYDAMTSNRSYRKFLPQAQVRSEIEKNSGTQFDPVIAECMIGIIDDDGEYELHE